MSTFKGADHYTFPLFEIIINFFDTEQADFFTEDRFGIPAKEDDLKNKQWIFQTDKDFDLIVEQLMDKVKLIGTIAGSNWQKCSNL